MATTINAGNATSGAAISADTTGILALQSGSTPTTAVTIDASQRVGIGTSSPSAPLQIQANSSGIAVRVQGRSPDGYGSLGYYNNAVTTLQGQVDVNNTGMYFGTTIATPIQFYTNDTERMRINSSGQLIVNSTAQIGGRINSYGDGSFAAYYGQVAVNGDFVFGIRNQSGTVVGGIVANSGSVSYNTTSDYRLKENIAPMTGALNKISALKPVTYTWKATGETTQGFIAHELAEIIPDCVTGEKDAMRTEQYEVSTAVPATYDEEGNEVTPAIEAVMGEREVPQYQGIDTSFLVATLTAAIQELNAKVDAQAVEIAALKGNA
jgi:hypothetical protein